MKFFNTFDFIENFFPNSPFVFLIFLFSFFLFTTLFILIVAKLLKKEKRINKEEKILTINDLLEIVKNENSTIQDLIFSIEYFNNKFRVKQFPDKAFKFFKLLLTHKNRNKLLFDKFHNQTIKLNESFKEQLSDIEKKCLNG